MLVTIQLTFLVLAFLKNNGVANTQIPVPKITDVAFSSDNCLWLLLRNGAIKKSSDFGNTWVTSDATSFNIEHFFFLSQDLGWAVSRNGAVWQYTKSKDTWESISKLKRYADSPFATFQIHFVNKDQGYIVALWHVYITNDGGKTWREIKKPNIGREYIWDPVNIFFLTSLKGWIGDSNGKIFVTEDGGENWTLKIDLSNPADVLFGSPIIYDLFFTDNLNGWVISSPDSGFLKTRDGGKKWELQLELVNRSKLILYSIFFMDQNEGWVVGKDMGVLNRGVILHTTNSGKNWSEIKIENSDSSYKRVYFSGSNGWLIGENSIYRTQDGGKSWQMVLELE